MDSATSGWETRDKRTQLAFRDLSRASRGLLSHTHAFRGGTCDSETAGVRNRPIKLRPLRYNIIAE